MQRGALRRKERELAKLRGQESDSRGGIICKSRSMENVLDLAQTVSRVDTTVLITGESGVGKELVARFVHDESPRADAAFVAVNCGALPEPLLESELFGHVEGAFTGADADKVGLFEAAKGGTLFLDEIGETSDATQVKLLRVLQEKAVRLVGSTESRHVDVRVVAATTRNLEEMVAKGTFRKDLYYRLKVVSIEVPPLRERREDILPLARELISVAQQTYGLDRRTLAPDAVDALTSYSWPGNVRELQNAVQRAAVLSDRPVLLLEDLPPAIRRFAGGSESAMSEPSDSAPASPATPPGDVVVESSRMWLDGEGMVRNQAETIEPAALPDTGAPYLPPGMTLSQIEELAIRTSMERAGGNISKVARELGVSRSVLYRKLDRYGLRQRD